MELEIVLEARLGPVGTALVERFLRVGPIEVLEVDRDTANAAFDSWRRHGKSRHQAGLDYGDRFVYALATIEGASILCVGDDLASTDLEVVKLI